MGRGHIALHVSLSGFPGIHDWGWGSVGHISVPPPHTDPCLSYNRGFRCKEGLNIAACLLRLSLPISSEARADPSVEFLDGPLVPLLARSCPSVHGRPSIIINPSLPHLLTQGGAWGSEPWDLKIDFLKQTQVCVGWDRGGIGTLCIDSLWAPIKHLYGYFDK